MHRRLLVSLVVSVLLFNITACNDDGGGANNNPPPLSFVQPPLSSGSGTFTTTHFSGSDNCAVCHDGISDSQGNDLSVVTDWSSTMMANSTRDPFWIAKVRSELNRNPALTDLINDKCTRCHAPMANEEMQRNSEYISLFDDGLLNITNSRHDAAMDGVSCTLCHQVLDSAKLGTLEGFSGQFEINENRAIYGSYSNVLTQPMINRVGYTPGYSAHIQASELCATCHELKTPYVDQFGNILSQTPEDEFPEQTPYSEWLNSDYVNQQSCQDCHMSRANGVVMATRPMSLSTQRDNFSAHDFVGANKMMLDILDQNRQQLGVRSNNFAETIHKTEIMLANAASIALQQSSLSNDLLSFTLQINSATGHKLPSGYPSRRVVLHVTVHDSTGQVVFESGAIDSDGRVAGLDSDNDLLSYEPHYDLITRADQVQVYEAIMADSDDQVNYTLLRSAKYLKDNRILPNGFDKNSVPNDVAVQGAAFSDDDFLGGGDQISYQIALPSGESYSVSVELLYQTIAYAFAEDLFRDSSPEITDFKQMYDASQHKVVPMTTLQFSVQ